MNKIFKYYLLAFILFSDFALFAQDPGDDDGGGGLEGDDLPAAPINSKLIWLGLIGILFAFYMYKKRKASILQS